MEKWLWMRQLDYTDIFWTLVSVRCAMFCAVFVFASCICGSICARQLRRVSLLPKATGHGASFLYPEPMRENGPATSFRPGSSRLPSSFLAPVSLCFLPSASTRMGYLPAFRYGGSFGVSDPLFGIDVGFYLFHLPFYELLQSSLTLLTVAALTFVLLVYGLLDLGGSDNGANAAGGSIAAHLSSFFLFWSQIWVGDFTLITTSYFTPRRALFMEPGIQRICDANRALGHGRVSAWRAWSRTHALRPRFMTLVAGAGVYVVLWIFGVSLAPYLVQKFFVRQANSRWRLPI